MAGARPRPGLGRGLSALLGEAGAPPAIAPAAPVAPPAEAGPPRTLPIERIRPMPGQPRRRFDPEAMAELVDSIRAQGVLTPLIVRPKDGAYELIAGERRWRAAQQAQIHELPVVVRELDDEAALQAAIVENTQRADLNAIEEAQGYARLRDEFGHTIEAIARMVSKSRSHVSNLIRMLDLPMSVRAMVEQGRLSAGHARALIGLEEAEALAEEAVERGLSVREVELLAAEARHGPGARAARAQAARGTAAARGGRAAGATATGAVAGHSHDPDIAALEQRLADALGLIVSIGSIGGGEQAMVIYWQDLDQLDMLVARLTGGRM